MTTFLRQITSRYNKISARIPLPVKSFLFYHILVYKEAGYNPIFFIFKVFFFPVDFKRDTSKLQWWDYIFYLFTLGIYVWLIEWILRIILTNWGVDLWLPVVSLFSVLTVYFFGNLMFTLILSFAVFPFLLLVRLALLIKKRIIKE